jgi:hypothetical protein
MKSVCACALAVFNETVWVESCLVDVQVLCSAIATEVL